MKKLITLTTVFMLVLIIAACGNSSNSGGNSGASSDKPAKLKVAYHPNMGGSSAVITGIKKGFFEEQNLEIELVKFTSGPPEIAAMVSGDLDVGYVGHGAHFLAIQGQVDIITIDLLGKAEELMVTKASGITKVEELKGKTVATQLGTAGEIVLELALKRAGMTKDDVKLINMDMAGAVSAFITNKVDAAVVWAPYTHEIRKVLNDEVVTLADSASFSDEFVFPASWVATPKFIENNEEVVVRFLKGLLNAMDYRAENLDEVVDLVAELNDTPKDSVMLEKESAQFLSGAEIRQLFEDGTAKKWYEEQQKLFLNNGSIDKEAPVEDYVTFDLIKKTVD